MAGFKSKGRVPALDWRLWSLAFAVCALGHSAPGASPDTFLERGVQSWQRQHGLPENLVKALCQTRDGYLWIGTYSGLARFDGLKFTGFNRLNLPGLPSDVCKVLAEDREGNLWVGTDSGLVRWNREALDVFTTEHGLNSSDIRLLCATRQGRLWVATDKGLDCFSGGKFIRLTAQDGLKADFVASMYEDASGVLWISTIRGIQRWNSASGHFEDVVNYAPDESSNEWSGLWSNCHLSEQAGALWLGQIRLPGDEFSGLTLLNCANNETAAHVELARASPARLFNYTNEPGIPSGQLQGILPDRRGNVWLAAERAGLIRFHDDRFSRYGRDQGLSDEWLLTLLEDREGNLWVGTRFGGLHQLRPRPFRVYGTDDGLPHDKAWTMCESRDGSVWLGTDGGVTLWQDGVTTNYTVANGLANTAVRSLHEDLAGTLWIGTGDGLFSLREGRVTRHRPVPGAGMQKIRVINSDRAGNLWVGWEHGLLQFTNRIWRAFTTNDGLAHNDVRAVLEDRHGALWLGTFGGGLIRWQEGRMTVFTARDGLASDFAWTLYEDGEGVLWIGTEQGLTRHEDGRLTSYTTREGLFDNLINQILEDDRGNLWLSCDRGIFRVSKAELRAVADGEASLVQSVVYSEADGLLSAETNGRKSQPAGCKTRDGRLWFPTAKGAAVVDPAKLDYEEIPPPVVIEEVYANGRLIFNNSRGAVSSLLPLDGARAGVRSRQPDAAATSSAKSAVANHESEIHLPTGGARLLAFQYTANCLSAPERVRFKYRLLGSHSDWIEAGTRRVAYYTNLRPGHYRYQVIAANHHGVWNDTGAILAFYLAPFFYQTWWFYGLCALVVVILAFGLHQVRVGVVRKIEALQKARALAEARLHIARGLHEQLGARLTHLVLLSDTLRPPGNSPTTSVTHQNVTALARDSAGDLGDLVWAVDPRCDTLESFTSYVTQVVEEFCREREIKCSFDIPKRLPPEPLASDVRHALLLAVKDILRGVAEERQPSPQAIPATVAIRIALETAAFVVIIEAFPLGPPKSRQGLERTSSQPVDANSRFKAVGERVQAIGGSFEIQNVAGNTSRFVIRISRKSP